MATNAPFPPQMMTNAPSPAPANDMAALERRRQLMMNGSTAAGMPPRIRRGGPPLASDTLGDPAAGGGPSRLPAPIRQLPPMDVNAGGGMTGGNMAPPPMDMQPPTRLPMPPVRQPPIGGGMPGGNMFPPPLPPQAMPGGNMQPPPINRMRQPRQPMDPMLSGQRRALNEYQ